MIIYRSFYEAINELSAENQARIWRAVMELGFNGVEIELSGLDKTIFTLIKPQIDANIKRYQNGKRPKEKQIESKKEANQEQKVSEKEANKNNNKNKNKNKNTLGVRKSDFYKKVGEHVDKYPKEMLRDFFEYWSEYGENDIKMRFEKEKTFGLSRRLSTWFKNSKTNYSESQDPLVSHINKQLGK